MQRTSTHPRFLLTAAAVSMAIAVAFIAVVVLLVFVAACSSGDDNGPSVTGVVVDVQQESLTQTQAFTVRSDAGEDVVFRVAPDVAPDQIGWFVPSHLQSIQTTGEEVTVFYRDDGGVLLAESMEHTITTATAP